MGQNDNGEVSLHCMLKKKNKQNDTESTLRNRKQSEESKECEDVIEDPLTWFGAMVPRPVCTAQNDFSNALSLLIAMANIEKKLLQLNGKWDALCVHEK